MDGKNWDVLTKRIRVEKRISGIICEIPGGDTASPAFLFPSADARWLIEYKKSD